MEKKKWARAGTETGEQAGTETGEQAGTETGEQAGKETGAREKNDKKPLKTPSNAGLPS